MKNKLLKVLPLAIAGLLMGVTSSGVFGSSTMVKAENEPNSTAEVDCNLGATYNAVTIAYDGTASKVYGAQAYAGITGPAWAVGATATMANEGTDSHGFGSNHGDGRNGLEITMKFDSTVEGESFLKLYCQTDVNSDVTFTENGYSVETNFSNFSTDLGVAWDSAVAKLIPVTVRTGVNTYSFKLQDNYTCWMYAFGLDAISARNETGTKDVDSLTTANAPAVGYYGPLTKIYGLQAYAKISGQSWLNSGVFDRLQDGSSSHGIGNNGWETQYRDGKDFKFEINVNSYVEGDGYIDLFAENRGYDNGTPWADGKFNLTQNDGEAVAFELNELQPVDWNHNVATPVPVTFVKGNNKFVFEFQDYYTAWIYGFRVGDRTVRKFHDVGGHNYLIREAADPVTVDYEKGDSPVYGLQAYAGTTGEAWVATDTAPGVTDGVGSRKIGGMQDKGAFALILSINSASAQTVTINLGVEHYMTSEWEQYKAEVDFTLKVNDGEEVAKNLYDITGESRNIDNPTPIEGIELVEGVNTITIAVPANTWKMWFGSFQILGGVLSYDRVTVDDYSAISGDWSYGTGFYGINAFDSSADYGKTGTIDYTFRTTEAGQYDLYLTVMAGNDLSNRVEIKVNDVTVEFGGKPYFSFNTSLGWAGDSVNKISLTLPEGVVKLTIGPSLVRVNEEKSAEVSEGGVLVTNWWMHALSINKTAVSELVIDTTNATTSFLPYRDFTSEGIVVKIVDHANSDAERTLGSDEYTIDSSEFDSTKNGAYKIYVTETATGLTGFYNVSVGGDQIVPFAGKTLEFDGENTAYQSFYNAEIYGEGTGVCEGRIAWVSTGDGKLDDGGYVIGSNGSGEWENRQVSFKLHINSAVAGKFLVSMYMKSEYSDNPTLTLKVNDGEEVTSNLFFCNFDIPYKMYVDLVEGENIISIRTSNCYRFWFHHYTVSVPTYVEVGTKVNAIDCARWGAVTIDCNQQDLCTETTEKRQLTCFYDVAEAGSYELQMETPTGANKVADILVDGVKVATANMSNGQSNVHFDLTAGKHAITIDAGGSNSGFSLRSVTLVNYVACTGLTLDTTNVTTEVEYDGLISYSQIVVTANFSDGSTKVLTSAEYRVVEPENFSTTVAGDYTFTVVYLADETITATFTITVLAEAIESSEEPVVSSEEPVVSSETPVESSEPAPVESSETPVESSAEATSSEPTVPDVSKGCGGSIAACGLISLVALGAAILLKSKKED